MRNRRVSAICDRCKEKIYGDNYGPLGHKCRPALEMWQIFDDTDHLHRSCATELDAIAFCEELNFSYKAGKGPYRVLHMIEETGKGSEP